MKISVIGTGYVGLVSGVCLAEKGHLVQCVDVLPEKVDRINAGEPPIFEKGLERLLKRNIGERLSATTDLNQAVLASNLSFIAVGTPFDGDNIDLTYIKTVTTQIGETLREKSTYHVVVVKSTVVPGTTNSVILPLLETASGKQAGRDFGVGMNPEFLREGEAIHDFMHPDRIVLGGIDQQSLQYLSELYSVFEEVDIVKTNPKTAEMIKYTANSLLATMISFSNEIGNLCSSLGNIDVTEVMQGVHSDKRLSPILEDGTRVKPGFTSYLEAGCGFGGSCLPKDVKALIAHGQKAANPMSLLESVIEVNRQQPKQVLKLLDRHYSKIHDTKIAVLGLAFKPGTNDMRESPAIPIVSELLNRGATVRAFDPVARSEAEKLFRKGVTYFDDLGTAIDRVDVIVLLTSWPEFEDLPNLLNGIQPQPLVIDGRRMIDKRRIERYEGIGLCE